MKKWLSFIVEVLQDIGEARAKSYLRRYHWSE